MSRTDLIAQKNRLLGAMPQDDTDRFFLHLHSVSFSLKQIVYEVGAPLEHVYFVEQGVVSILAKMTNGKTIEVGMIGMEGVVGLAGLRRAIIGVDYSTSLREAVKLCVEPAKPSKVSGNARPQEVVVSA